MSKKIPITLLTDLQHRVKILQFVLTSQAKYIQPELRKQRDKIEANVVEK